MSRPAFHVLFLACLISSAAGCVQLLTGLNPTYAHILAVSRSLNVDPVAAPHLPSAITAMRYHILRNTSTHVVAVDPSCNRAHCVVIWGARTTGWTLNVTVLHPAAVSTDADPSLVKGDEPVDCQSAGVNIEDVLRTIESAGTPPGWIRWDSNGCVGNAVIKAPTRAKGTLTFTSPPGNVTGIVWLDWVHSGSLLYQNRSHTIPAGFMGATDGSSYFYGTNDPYAANPALVVGCVLDSIGSFPGRFVVNDVRDCSRGEYPSIMCSGEWTYDGTAGPQYDGGPCSSLGP
ncbi:MAG: hypothetical protein ACYDDF_13615 [Thermoplasmatota archaeon]